MRNTYTLWIVSPPDLVWSHVFDEVALAFQSAFRTLGHNVPIVTDSRQIEGTAIVFGANLCPMYKIPLPDHCIVFNLEQVHPASRWFQPDYGYIELLKQHSVWDYNRQNIEALRQFGIEGVVHCGIGYAPELTRIRRGKEDTDVVFIGGGHPRRKKILDRITASGMKLQEVYKVFGKERDNWIARGKIHLNIHKEPAGLFEIVRVSYLLANRSFVISEQPQDREMAEAFKDAVVFCPYDQLVEQCRHYLVHPKERKRIAEAGFEIFRNMPQKDYLANALEEHRQLDSRRTRARKKQPLLPTGEPMPRIFVAIASYRDPEIDPTLADMFAKATYPDRIRAGVCLQIDPREDAACTINPALRPRQIGIRQVHYKDSKGANWARNQALEMMDGEDYVLLIDSHMRFEPGWDEDMLAMLRECPSEKPVLSGYIPEYKPPDRRDYQAEHLLRIKIRRLGAARDPQLIHVTGKFVFFADERAASLYPTPFCVANFIFMPASTLKEVPIDPHIHFWGDEINFAARLWTHGYDIFQPNRVVMFHYWVRQDEFHLHQYREHFTPENARSMERLRHLLGFKEAEDKQALADIGRYGLGTERPLADLWKFAGIDWKRRRITQDAEEGIWDMAAREKSIKKATKKPQQAKPKALPPSNLPRIFVQIASYRDPDCQWTVKDMFEKAAHPERVFAGICWQFVRDEDEQCFEEPYPYPDHVRVHEVDATRSKGVCWARSLVQKLWKGEEFVFQIDSHMRFEPGWDDMLISMWEACENDKAVLTCYPPGFTPPDKFERKWIFGMSAKHFDAEGIFLMHGKPAFQVGKEEPEKPIPGAFASANMLFGPASILKDVPYDPYLYFFGEEITLAVRLWTSGYDLYHPNRLVIFHDWNRGKRPTHFSDFPDWRKLNDPSYKRVRHLLNVERTTDQAALKELTKYGLGNVRTLDQYQKYSGVDFARKTISPDAHNCKFTPLAAPKKKEAKPEEKIAMPKAPAILKGSVNGKTPKIFINIASYRDPECQWTVKDLFEKASKPERINVGICWQFDSVEDQHCFEVNTRPEQVRMFPVDWREAEGVCWARHQTQQLWDGEHYTLMTDSHMRFVPGWDELMINELAECESGKPLLSCSPTPYTPPNNLGTRMNPTVRRVKPFFPDGNIRCHGEMLDRHPPKPLKGAFVVANFIFSKSEITPEVPYDPYLYFDQEEITYAARLFTHGWDVFSSRHQFLYHYYNDVKVPTGSVRPLHWRDLRQQDEKRIHFLRDRGLKRFNHLTRHKPSTDMEVIKELDIYGFGRERTFEQFEQYSGIDFRNKVASDRALRCQFIEDLHIYRDRPIFIPELDDPKIAAQKTAAKPADTKPPAVNGAAAAKAPPPSAPKPPVTEAAKSEAKHFIPAPVKLLEPGDFLPFFEIDDTNKKVRAVEMFGGKHTMLFYLPADNIEFLTAFLTEQNKLVKEAKLQDVWQLFLLDAPPEKLIEIREKHKFPQTFCADPGRRVGQSLGICKPGENFTPVGFVLNNNLKIEHRHASADPHNLAAAIVHECAVEKERFREKFLKPMVFSETAPALIVPNALSPELCAKLIHAFRTGRTFEGTVGAEQSKAYRPDSKVRTDFIVEGALLAEVDDKLSRSFFPELKKVFGFEVTHRELYKVGMYSGEKKGFFRQHRDNFDIPMGYRRIASTIQLNDDYEDGGLRFPEYGDNIYRPATGSAIAFSCQTLHEALPVTKGERFILVGFFHGPEDEAFRLRYQSDKGLPLKLHDYTPTLRKFHELRLSRAFYDKWQQQNVSYTADNAAAKDKAVETPALHKEQPALNIMVNTIGNHQPKKIYESKAGIIFDDFLPEDVYEKLHSFCLTTDYERINTHGKSTRAWHIHDGFPLRTCKNYFYHAIEENKPQGDHIYPTKTPVDQFIDHLLAIQPQVEHMVGKSREQWGHVTVTGWIYPHGTGLSMHDDGSGVYTGAYAYFLNPTWRPHWGGLLLLTDEEANSKIHEYRSKIDQMDYYHRKWLHVNPLDEMLMEHGLARCIYPKRNRIVFIANNAYHMVTRVNEQAGDNVRMSLAGFFTHKSKSQKK